MKGLLVGGSRAQLVPTAARRACNNFSFSALAALPPIPSILTSVWSLCVSVFPLPPSVPASPAVSSGLRTVIRNRGFINKTEDAHPCEASAGSAKTVRCERVRHSSPQTHTARWFCGGAAVKSNVLFLFYFCSKFVKKNL